MDFLDCDECLCNCFDNFAINFLGWELKIPTVYPDSDDQSRVRTVFSQAAEIANSLKNCHSTKEYPFPVQTNFKEVSTETYPLTDVHKLLRKGKVPLGLQQVVK